MANVTTPTDSTLPVAGGDIIAAPLSGWITNLKNFVEGANIDENNVDYTSFDGIVVKSQTQTLSGAKTFSSVITATAGLISGSNIVSDTDSTDNLGTTLKRWANLYVDSIGDTGQDLTIAATTTNLPSGHITDYNSADVTITHSLNTLTIAGGTTVVDALTSGGNIVSDTDSTDDLGTTGVRWANLYVDDVTVTNNVTIGGTLTLTGGITLNGNTTIGDSSADTLTVNSTITSNLIFTDNTYDIGASGATRPRDLFLSRNAVMGGTLGVTGATTLSSTLGVTGALTATAGITSGSDIVSDSDSTDDLGTTSVRWANLYVDSIGDTGQALAITAGSNNINVTAGTLALTGAQTISSTLGVTGLITATGGVSGNVTGGTISGTTGTFTGALSAQTLTANNGILYLDDNGSHNGVINVPASLLLNIDSDNSATNEKFQIAKDRSGTSGGTVLFELGEDGDLAVDTDTLFVDASADRVGINNNSPSTPLHVKDASTAYVMAETTGTSTSAGFRLKGDASADYTIFTTQGVGNFGIYDNANTAQRLTIDTSGNVDLSGERLKLGGTTNNGVINNIASVRINIDSDNNGSTEYFAIGHDQESIDANNELFRVQEDGRVGIGTNSPSYKTEIAAGASTEGLAVTASSGDVYLQTDGQLHGYQKLDVATAGLQIKGFSNGGGTKTQTGAVDILQTSTSSAGGFIKFSTHDGSSVVERARIDSSGNFGIGTTSPRYNLAVKGNNSTAVGIAVDNDSGSSTLDISALGSTYNAHGAAAGEIWFYSPDNINIGGATGNTNDIKFLGNGSERARILSSGGITFNGDTAAANALDDYEEGTWTPTFTPSTSGSITLAAGGGAYYTKIGQLVTATLSVTVASVSSPIGYVSVNLPFAPNTSNQKGRSGVAVYVDGLAAGHNTRDAIALTEDSSATLRIYQGDSNSNQSDFAQAVGAGTYFNLTVSYIV